MFCLCAKELDGIRVRSGNPAENVEVNMSTFPAGKEMKMQKDEKGVAVVIHLLWNFLILPERCDVNIFASSSSGNGVCRCKAHLVAVRLSNDRLNHRRRDAEFRAPKPKCVMSPSHLCHMRKPESTPQSSTCHVLSQTAPSPAFGTKMLGLRTLRVCCGASSRMLIN